MKETEIIQKIKRSREFLAADVTGITDVKRNRLQAWMERGWITPSIEKASGHGSRNRFSDVDLVIISIFKKLVESGLSRKATAAFVPALVNIKNDLHKIRIPNELDCEASYYEAYWVIFFRVDGVPTESIGFLSREAKDVFTSEKALAADDVIGINLAKVFVEISKRLSKK